MRSLRRAGVLLWLAIAAGVVVPAGAQPMPAPIVNPPGVRLRLDLTDAGPFREMQIIRGSIQLDRQSQPAAALQQRGGPAAQEALWEAMRHFQRSWKGREDELARHSEATQFEFVLAAALTQARHWILPPDDLRRLDALCTGNPCRQQTTSALSVWKQPIALNGYITFGQFHGHVGHHNVNSREELLARIRQLPPGTRVRISAGGSDPGPFRSAILSEAAAGLIVE